MITTILNSCSFCELCLTSSANPICDACFCDLPWIEHHCMRCGRGGAVRGVCVSCQKQNWAFTQCFAPFHYQPPMKPLVTRLKNQGELHLARTLSHCFTQAAQDYGVTMPELLIPVPSHARRIWQRGFNQSIELTRFIAKTLKLSWSTKHVVRCKHTPPQRQLKRQQRQGNLQDAFALRKPCPTEHIAIVDDVITTGTTANTLAKLLKDAGVKRVDVWAICESVLR